MLCAIISDCTTLESKRGTGLNFDRRCAGAGESSFARNAFPALSSNADLHRVEVPKLFGRGPAHSFERL